jgi:hypothetical protein
MIDCFHIITIVLHAHLFDMAEDPDTQRERALVFDLLNQLLVSDKVAN